MREAAAIAQRFVPRLRAPALGFGLYAVLYWPVLSRPLLVGQPA